MNICLFTREELESGLDLRDERARHLLTVLHKGEGDSFCAGIVGGESGQARIESVEVREQQAANGKSFRGGRLRFSFRGGGDGKPLYPLVMLVGFPRPIQLKRLLRDMAGLGVRAVCLCGTELGEKSYLKSSLASEDACAKMLLEGTIQAASTHVPRVRICESLGAALRVVREETAEFGSLVKLAMDNVSPEQGLSSWLDGEKDALGKGGACAVSAVGSERGWTDGERGLLRQDGFRLLGMGRRVFRTETAATVSASLILSAMGRL